MAHLIWESQIRGMPQTTSTQLYEGVSYLWAKLLQYGILCRNGPNAVSFLASWAIRVTPTPDNNWWETTESISQSFWPHVGHSIHYGLLNKTPWNWDTTNKWKHFSFNNTIISLEFIHLFTFVWNTEVQGLRLRVRQSWLGCSSPSCVTVLQLNYIYICFFFPHL